MATKKSVAKKAASTEPAAKAAESGPAKKTAATKVAVKKTAAKKGIDVHASGTDSTPQAGQKTSAKLQPSHHDISVQAYLAWERDGKQHGHADQYWKQAERDLLEQ